MGDAAPARSMPEFDPALHLSPNRRAWQRFKKNRPAFISLGFLVILIFLITLWPFVSRHDATTLTGDQFHPPSLKYLCGTDVNGRDLLARMFSGAWISLLVGIVGAVVSLVIGVAWGAVAGYKGGRWDSAMMRAVDILYALPSIVFVIVLISTFDGLLKRWGSSAVDRNDLKDAGALVVQLRDTNAPVAAALLADFPPALRARVNAFDGGSGPDDELQKELAGELNKALMGPVLFDEKRFAAVALRAKTKSAWQRHQAAARRLPGLRDRLAALPGTNALSAAQTRERVAVERELGAAIEATTGAALMRVNRLYLEDAFPDALARRETWFTLAMTALFSPKLGASTQMLFLFVGLGAVSWLTMARIVRGQVLSLRTRQFVDASRALGATHARVLLHHILPNIIGIIIVYLALTVPAVILYESFLSFLGLGIQPPSASWGTLISEGARQLNPVHIYWWLIVFPAAMMVTTLLALNFLGDGLRDAFDPRAQT